PGTERDQGMADIMLLQLLPAKLQDFANSLDNRFLGFAGFRLQIPGAGDRSKLGEHAGLASAGEQVDPAVDEGLLIQPDQYIPLSDAEVQASAGDFRIFEILFEFGNQTGNAVAESKTQAVGIVAEQSA